tara:strand:- start:257 stop:640 length:384 start_codon:yes stop_codon:yes gene_type:complete
MSHYAKIQNGVVIQVIVAEPEFFNSFVDTSAGEWIQTSYNTRGGVHYQPNSNTPSEDQSNALRKNYAGIGYSYDAERDAFIPPKPYNSWVLNEESCLWEPPIPYPENSHNYDWNEAEQQWVLLQGAE